MLATGNNKLSRENSDSSNITLDAIAGIPNNSKQVF